MNTKPEGMVTAVQDGTVAVITATGDIVQAAVDAFASTLASTIKDARKEGVAVPDVITVVVGCAIRGVTLEGVDLTKAGKGIMLGVLRGAMETGTASLDTFTHTAQVAILDTFKVRGDLDAATTGLLAGAIEVAEEMGVTPGDAAAAAADGALKAAGRVGSAAVETVRQAVSKPINSVNVVLNKAFDPAQLGGSSFQRSNLSDSGLYV